MNAAPAGDGASRSAPATGTLFDMGPDQSNDLRQQRPYFVVPLDLLDQPSKDDPGQTVRDKLLGRVTAWIQDSAVEEVSSLLRYSEITDKVVPELASVLLDPQHPAAELSAHIRDFISCDTERLLQQSRKRLSNWQTRALRIALINELNALIQDDCLDPTGCLDATGKPLQGQELMRRNRRILERAYPDLIPPSPQKGKVTDLYILSHGWHRNFFGAVAAYDQLVSRLAVLMHRARLTYDPPYNPIFLALHWHSDPGQNGWFDGNGRRNKASFLRNVEELFERPSSLAERHQPPSQRFTDIFEDIFELFSRMSAHDTSALDNAEIENQAKKLGVLLEGCHLRDAASAEPADKVAAAWTCYYRALPKRLLTDQSQPSGRFIRPWDAFKTFIKFLMGAGGMFIILSVLSHLWQRLQQSWLQQHWLSTAWGSIVELFRNLGFGAAPRTAAVVTLYLIAFGLSVAYLWYKARPSLPESAKPNKGIALPRLLAWLIIEIPCVLPAVAYAVVTYFFSGFLVPLVRAVTGASSKAVFPLLFDERFGNRNQEIAIRPEEQPVMFTRDAAGEEKITIRSASPRLRLAHLALWPVKLLRQGIARNSESNGLIDALNNQLAFWEMQFRGVDAGNKAAHFVARLLEKPINAEVEGTTVNCLDGTRIHFLGHSFGALVVANAVRHLALDKELRLPDGTPQVPGIHSLCLLQGAIATNWFEEEQTLVQGGDGAAPYIRGALANIYSAYDTANGFYYPLANHGRLAAGFLGLYWPDKNVPARAALPGSEPGNQGLFASLTAPPDLVGRLPAPAPAHPYIVNLDASRMIYEGGVALGGGHDDIFKDDVLHLVWAVTRLNHPNVAVTSATMAGGVAPPASPNGTAPRPPVSREQCHTGKPRC